MCCLPCFSGYQFALKSPNNLSLQSHNTDNATSYQLLPLPSIHNLHYLSPLLIPPSLVPGTLFHHSKLLFLSHSFSKWDHPEIQLLWQVLQAQVTHTTPSVLYTFRLNPPPFQLQLTVRSNFSLVTSTIQKCETGKGLFKSNEKGTYCSPMGNFTGMTEQESNRTKVTANLSSQHREPQPWQSARNLQVLHMWTKFHATDFSTSTTLSLLQSCITAQSSDRERPLGWQPNHTGQHRS